MGTRLPTSERTPSAKAMSVATGMPQPELPGPPALMITKIPAGTTMPPSAATIGSAAWRRSRSSPCTASRLISSPMTKKKITIKPSLIQPSSDSRSVRMSKSRTISVRQNSS